MKLREHVAIRVAVRAVDEGRTYFAADVRGVTMRDGTPIPATGTSDELAYVRGVSMALRELANLVELSSGEIPDRMLIECRRDRSRG